MNDTEYLSKLLQSAYATSSFSDFAKQFPMISNEIKPKVVSKRNQLTQRQTQALIKLWEKWRTEGNLKLNRIAHSPYGLPYISIERRDDLTDKQFEWNWCITYHEEYDGQGTQIIWYSNSKDPMPKQIKDFLRMAYNREFVVQNATEIEIEELKKEVLTNIKSYE
jgi:hypothetical protein